MIGMKSIRFPPPVADEMVRAILDDRKTVTRWVVKAQEPDWKFLYLENDPYMTQINRNGEEYPSQETGLWAVFEWGAEFPLGKAPCRPGDILYVRETWAAWSRTMGTPPALYYKADGEAPDGIKWRPSIHMPREVARIFLRVTDVRVEWLRSITEGQAKKEGAVPAFEYNTPEGPVIVSDEDGYYILGFKGLWNSTIKPADRALYGWCANPWVWVTGFERCGKPEAFPYE